MDGYTLLKTLGAGAFGVANLAVKKDTNEKCVIKVINMTKEDMVESQHEVKILSSLSHPYVTKFLDSLVESGRLLIIMDYCSGGDLSKLIKDRKGVNFPEEQVLDWFVQMCLAMKYIHDKKILHRDIKTANIFLTGNGRVKFGDFGLSKVLASTLANAKTQCGTLIYMSPEMIESRQYNDKSDIWALGCVLYEMAALMPPFDAIGFLQLCQKIVKCTYAPIPDKYSKDMRLLISEIFQQESKSRPSASTILKKSFMLKRIPRFITGCEEEEILKAVVADYEREHNNLTKKLERQTFMLNRQHAAKINNLQKELALSERQTTELNLQHAANMNNLQEKLALSERKTSELNRQHAAKINNLQEKLALSELKTSELNRHHAAKINNLHEKLALSEHQTNELNLQHAATMNNLQEKLDLSNCRVDEFKNQHATKEQHLKKCLAISHANEIKPNEEKRRIDIQPDLEQKFQVPPLQVTYGPLAQAGRKSQE